jgi:hypothetical protein
MDRNCQVTCYSRFKRSSVAAAHTSPHYQVTLEVNFNIFAYYCLVIWLSALPVIIYPAPLALKTAYSSRARSINVIALRLLGKLSGLHNTGRSSQQLDLGENRSQAVN